MNHKLHQLGVEVMDKQCQFLQEYMELLVGEEVFLMKVFLMEVLMECCHWEGVEEGLEVLLGLEVYLP